MSLEAKIADLENLISEQGEKIDTLLSILEQMTGTKSNVVSTSEAALMLGVSENTIRIWHLERKMPKNIGIGRNLKFERKAIEKMTKAQKTGKPRKAA